MGWFNTIRGLGNALGVWKPVTSLGCSLGKDVYRETKRATRLANLARRLERLRPETAATLTVIFPELDTERIRFKTGCRLPPNRFRGTGGIYAMTFGYTVYWRGSFDESDPEDFVNFVHEVVHADQFRRYGGESGFACRYGEGYLNGGGSLPGYIHNPGMYELIHSKPKRTRSRPDSRTTMARLLPNGFRGNDKPPPTGRYGTPP